MLISKELQVLQGRHRSRFHFTESKERKRSWSLRALFISSLWRLPLCIFFFCFCFSLFFPNSLLSVFLFFKTWNQNFQGPLDPLKIYRDFFYYVRSAPFRNLLQRIFFRRLLPALNYFCVLLQTSLVFSPLKLSLNFFTKLPFPFFVNYSIFYRQS